MNTNLKALTSADIEALIVREQYHLFDGTTLTVCALTLKNGYVVTGESASLSAENFNQERGRELARYFAVQKIWPLEGYAARSAAASVQG